MNEAIQFIESFAGIYFRTVRLPDAGMCIPQHTHDEDHATLCSKGSADLYVDGVKTQTLTAGHAAEIKAGRKHEFVSLEADTMLTCIWDVEAAMRVKDKEF